MSLDVREINRRVRTDPQGFVDECNANYHTCVVRAADFIERNIGRSRVVLLAGPSASGKTTTAHNIERELDLRGIETHSVSFDDYYNDVDPLTAPRGAQGEYDFESPELLDLALMNEHFAALDAGREILIPHYDFELRLRSRTVTRPLKLKENELALFEGIHALNPGIIGSGAGSSAAKIYIAAGTDFSLDGSDVFFGSWVRILRRAIRDSLYRATPPAQTFAMWPNLRSGERRYIGPFRGSADIRFDTALPYEVNVLRCCADGIFDDLPENLPMRDELLRLRDALLLFEPLDEKYVPDTALVREFIGGLSDYRDDGPKE